MSSLKNSLPRKTHKERSQPQSRKKFGLLEKHEDYAIRAKNYHQKQEVLQKLKEKAALRNPDEFNFKMINSKTVDGVHRQKSQDNKYTQEELMLMKNQDSGYVLMKLQAEKKKVENLTATLHLLGDQPSNKHVYFAEDRAEAKEIQLRNSERKSTPAFEGLPISIQRKIAASYSELESRKSRVEQLQTIYNDMTMQKELQKKGNKRKLRPDEILVPTSRPVYKWRQERKR